MLLASDGDSTRMVWHALRKRGHEVHTILESPVSRLQLLKRRAKKLGIATVVGQATFMATAVPLLRWQGAKRSREILAAFDLDIEPIAGPITRVATVNDDDTRATLRRLSPSVVVVNGTRIIGSKTLRSVAAPFINTHAGITPFCRGVHGGYWALADGRPDLVGTTVHLVDEGIDTGDIIAQATFRPEPADSFATYPLLHTAAGIPLLLDAVDAALGGTLETKSAPADLPSRLRTHPTLWGYAWRRVTRAVR